MKKLHVIGEFGIIRNRADYTGEQVDDTFGEVYLPSKAFESLMHFIAENNDSANGVDQAFTVHLKNNEYFICVRNYVGLIETRDGTNLEILPKIYRRQECDEQATIVYCRSILLRMLRCLKDSPFKRIDQAHLKTTNIPVLEIFISLFLEEFELILQRGIKQHYITRRENETALKGRLQIEQQVRKNLIKKQYFFVEYDEFHADIPQNRILKAALTVLNLKTRLTRNRIKIINYLGLLDEIPFPASMEKDLIAVHNQSRLFSYYDQALKWARIFLRGESFTSFKGKEVNQAILFPMEQLFEAYVANQISKALTDWNVYVQDRKHHLVENHKGECKFRIRPDLVIKNNEVTIVADTKWKILDQNLYSQNYLISQSDMYQLYSYGKKYHQEDKNVKLLLIYPKHAGFTDNLHFDYDSALKLDIVPFDFEEPLVKQYPCFINSEMK